MPNTETHNPESPLHTAGLFGKITAAEMQRAEKLETRLHAITQTYIDRTDLDPTDLVSVYMKEVGSIPLLTKEEEIDLAKDIELAREALSILDSQKIEDEAEREALESVLLTGKLSSETFILANRRLVVSLAKLYQGSNVPLEDLIQEGTIGLMRAVEKFDYRLGYKFSTYATWWIKQAVSRCLGSNGRTRVIPVHTEDLIRRVYAMRSRLSFELGRTPETHEVALELRVPEDKVRLAYEASRRDVSLHQLVGEDRDSELGDFLISDVSTTDDQVVEGQRESQIEELLLALPARHARVIEYRYGIHRHELTLRETGEKFGVTRERIRQIEQEALKMLRRPDRAAKLVDYLH